MLTELASDWLSLVRASLAAAQSRQAEPLPAETLATLRATLERAHAVDGFWSRFGLNAGETLAAWVAIGAQLDHEIDRSVERLSGHPQMTLGALARVAFADDIRGAMQALDEHGPLVALRLLELVEDPHEPAPSWNRQRVRASRFLLDLALGIERSSELAAIVAGPCELPAEIEACSGVRERVASVLARDGIAMLVGAAGAGRRTLLELVARDAGTPVVTIDCRKLSKDARKLREQVAALARECRYRSAIPILASCDALSDDDDQRLDLFAAELTRLHRGPIALTATRRVPFRSNRMPVQIEMGRISGEQRAQLWQRSLGQITLEDAKLLAATYPLAPATIVRAARAALERAQGALKADDVFGAIRSVVDDALGAFARRIEVTQEWEDIVLDDDQYRSITELVARVRTRDKVFEEWGFGPKVGKGLGVTALFSGPPGTGKTMVASLIAKELRLELYQVDMSKVVSKYIGETEKNLAAVFDAAEACQAVLLFDEADALFGKRTDVKSSNDRHANFETNFLLQRLESFTGICLLTTNHESSMDPAFQRRLSCHLRFALPEVPERADLWRAMMPTNAPVSSDIDFEELARRYAMSGGYIRNATLRAAFVAAAEQVPISSTHLEHAARSEYRAMGKLA